MFPDDEAGYDNDDEDKRSYQSEEAIKSEHVIELSEA
jgi:hypothetical protein